MKNKAIMLSAKPKECANILNLIQSVLARKTFSRDYVGWVYIYCTKDSKEGLHIAKDKWVSIKHNKVLKECCYNGTVVARFWCDKVEEIYFQIHCDGTALETDNMSMSQLLKSSCLRKEELHKYLFKEKYKFGKTYGYAIHISKLEVFDKPRLLTMFRKPEFYKNIYDNSGNRLSLFERLRKYSVSKAPQNFCYIEEE